MTCCSSLCTAASRSAVPCATRLRGPEGDAFALGNRRTGTVFDILLVPTATVGSVPYDGLTRRYLGEAAGQSSRCISTQSGRLFAMHALAISNSRPVAGFECNRVTHCDAGIPKPFFKLEGDLASPCESKIEECLGTSSPRQVELQGLPIRQWLQWTLKGSCGKVSNRLQKFITVSLPPLARTLGELCL